MTKNVLAISGKMGDFSAFLAGALLTLAFAPFNLFPLAILSITWFLVLLLPLSPKRAFLRGWLFGIGLFGTGVSWVFVSIHTFGNASILVASAITALFVSILGVFPALTGFFLNRYFPDNLDTKLLLAFPALWVLLEWVRSWFLSGFPWLTVGDSQIHSPLIGYAPLLSVYGVSLMVVTTSSLLVLAYRQLVQHNHKAFFFKLFFILMIWGNGALLSLISWTQPIGPPVQVSLVQGNIAQSLKWSGDQVMPTLAHYRDLTAAHWDSKLIIWPESAIPLPLQNARRFVNLMDYDARKHRSALITGIPVEHGDNDSYFNAVIAVGNQTNDFYLKHRLVPFGEYTPFPSVFEGIMKKFDIPMSNLVRSTEAAKPIEVNGLKIATFICYEIAFAEQVISKNSDINMLLTVNDDAWFGHSLAPSQHLAMAQMRAIEMGRPLLFVSNTGITAIIDPHGKIQSIAPPDESYVLTGMVQPVHGETPWQRRAMDPLLLATIILIVRSAWIQRKFTKKMRSSSYA